MKAHTAKLYNWATQKAESSKAVWWIALLFSLECVLIIPLDAVLMFFCLQNRARSFLYAAIATTASAFSALFGYLLGHFLWDLIGPYLMPYVIAPATFDRISSHFQLYENWAVFLGALIPFPLKAMSLAAGVFHLGIADFLLFVVLGRLLRFFLIAASMVMWGEKVKQFVDRHFHRIILVIGAKAVAASLFFWAIAS